MYLSKIQIQGFKSFANKTSLEFQTGITAVVGPNGSGKSNTADAIRWVLGEQSLKLLRGKKSDDVIFAGSDKKGRLSVAEVSLHLNNEDHAAPIDYSEIVITRRVYRDGEGEYLINHQPARLQDIQLLLAQANFGQRTYSVIGQGMIDSFLISSPQERKHLFDEAAGVRQFQLKKDQAIHKLDQSKENLAQGESIMVEIEPRLKSLTRQVRRLERRGEIETTLRARQRLFYGLRWQANNHELSILQSHLVEAGKSQSALQDEVTKIQQELEDIERERSTSEAFAEMQKRYTVMLDEKNSLVSQQASVKAKLESSARDAGAEQVAFLQQRGQDTQRQVRQLKDEREAIEHQITVKRESLKKIEQELTDREHSFQNLERKVQEMQSALRSQLSLPEAHSVLDAWFQKYDAFVELVTTSEVAVDHIRTQSRNLHAEISSIVKKFSEHHPDIHPEALSGLQDELLAQAKQRQDIYQRVVTMRAEVHVLEQQVVALDVRLQQAQTEAEKIAKDVSLQELAKHSPDEAFAAYMEEGKRLERQVAEADDRLRGVREEINNFTTLESAKKDRLFALQKEFRGSQHQLNAATSRVNELQVQRARLEQRLEDLKREIHEAMGDQGQTEVEATATESLQGDVALLAEEIGSLRHQLELIGGIDEAITQEYQETNERWEYLHHQAEDLKSGINALEQAIHELDEIISKRFDTAFRKINEEFNTYFRTLFRGGRAELVLQKEVVTPDLPDVTEAEAAMAEAEAAPEPAPKKVAGEKVITGIEIKATPPGKKLQSIAMLSGGERALTSIALLCAIISNNPSPFVVLDEVDAALDEANSQRFSAILEQLAHKSQFITITHNRATMEKANLLYGVTMGEDGVSQLLSVKIAEAEKIIQSYGNR